MNFMTRISSACKAMQIIVLLLVALIPACAKKSGMPGNAPQGQTTEDLYRLAIQSKINCEARVISLKEYYSKNDKEYRKANALYDDAMVQFNSIFEITKSAIQHDSPLDRNQYKNDIDKAEKAGQDFLQYADNVIQPHERGVPILVSLVPLFEFVFKASHDVSDAFGGKDEKKKKEMVSYLDSLKWRHFRDIEPGH